MVNWDEVALDADSQPIQSVRSFAAAAEELHEEAGGLASFMGIAMNLNGTYRFTRAGNRFVMIGMLTMALRAMTDEMAPDAEEQPL